MDSYTVPMDKKIMEYLGPELSTGEADFFQEKKMEKTVFRYPVNFDRSLIIQVDKTYYQPYIKRTPPYSGHYLEQYYP